MDAVKDWTDIGLHQRTKYRNAELSSEDIYDLYCSANKKFYFRVSYFLQLFNRIIRHPREIKGFLMAGIYMVTEIFGGKNN